MAVPPAPRPTGCLAHRRARVSRQEGLGRPPAIGRPRRRWPSAGLVGTTRAMLEGMSFSGVWRDYQQRVLDAFDTHMSDHRVHVVAAPGSGKTVLGLELMRRLGRPALIL